MTIYDRIKELLYSSEFELHGNVSMLARTINMGQVAVNNYVLGKRKMSLDFVYNILASYPQISAEWLLRGEGTMIKKESCNSNSFNTNSILGNNNNSTDVLLCLVNQLAEKDRQINALIARNNTNE